MFLKIPLPRFTDFVFPLLKWLSVLVKTKVLLRMHKIRVKKDPWKLISQVRSGEIVYITHDKVLVLLKTTNRLFNYKLCCKNLLALLILDLFQFFTLKDLYSIHTNVLNMFKSGLTKQG